MKLLSPKDAGKVLGVTTSRMQQWDREGRLPAIRDSAGRRLFREKDVVRFLKERQRDSEVTRRLAEEGCASKEGTRDDAR